MNSAGAFPLIVMASNIRSITWHLYDACATAGGSGLQAVRHGECEHDAGKGGYGHK